MRAPERFEWINWGTTECDVRGCHAPADGWIDTLGPVCLECADDFVDHVQAIAECREAGVEVPAFLLLGFWRFDDPDGVLPTGLD